jgi:phosphoribosylaminoimidazole-succinocarboxamide synthase
LSRLSDKGSVFDIGAIFSIKNSGKSRSVFRHLVFTALANKEIWLYISKLNSNSKHKNSLEKFAIHGTKNHYKSMVSNDLCLDCDLNKNNISAECLIEKFNSYKLKTIGIKNKKFYDYNGAFIATPLKNKMIPLEYIVRLGVVSSSSLLKRFANMKGDSKNALLDELGVEDLRANTLFSEPFVELTSKLEAKDRPLSLQEASMVSSIEGEKFLNSLEYASCGALLIKEIFSQIGLCLWDLKWEFGFKNDEIYFADTLDTDSVRATYVLEKNKDKYLIHFNKQSIRDYYIICHPEWHREVVKSSEIASKKSIKIKDVLADRKIENPVIDSSFLLIQERKSEIMMKVALEIINSIEKNNTLIIEDKVKKDIRNKMHALATEEVEFYLQHKEMEEKFKAISSC